MHADPHEISAWRSGFADGLQEGRRDAEAERDRCRQAIEAIDDMLECAGHVASDLPPGSSGTSIVFDAQCFEAWPDNPAEWCASCIAHVALAGGPS